MENTEPIAAFINRLVEHQVKQEEANYTPSPIETREAFIARRKLALSQALTGTFQEAMSGYSCLWDSLSQDSNRDMSLYRFDLDRLNSVDVQKPLILYELFGWNEDVLGTFYLQACRLYSQERYKDALDAFTFLSVVSPLAADLYSALAICFTACNKKAEAHEAQELASFLQSAKAGQ